MSSTIRPAVAGSDAVGHGAAHGGIFDRVAGWDRRHSGCAGRRFALGAAFAATRLESADRSGDGGGSVPKREERQHGRR